MRRILLLIACALPLLQGGVRAECDPVPGIESLLEPGMVLLLGEIHGTVEGPRAVERLVCAALQAELDVAIGLEIPIVEEEAARKFLGSAGASDDVAAAIAGGFWQQEYQDGRASRAMLDLLHSLREHHSERLHLFFIDDPGAPKGRDRFMADRIAVKSAELPDAVIIVLTGNVHNRLTVSTRFNANYEPMGFHLGERLPGHDIVSLKITHSGGSAWVCAPDCGVIELRGHDGSTGVELESPNDDAYTGRLHVGRIHVSLPARER